jgi:NAD(P)-dependent dehydrogenase (short-subunit alcohol dehydrogenase family)
MAARDTFERARLDGRVVIVTGGSSGVGDAAARLCAARGAAGLVLVGRDEERGAAVAAAVTDLGADALFVRADLACVDDCLGVVAAADERFGVVHGLVNAAALPLRGTVWDTDAALWDEIMAVNVRAPFLLLQGAARIMRREGVAGSIVTIGSIAGHGGQEYLLPYSTSKGALFAFTRNAAYSLMRDRIRVNLLNPGWMDTPNEDATQRRFHGAGDGWLANAEAARPFGRLIKTDELARVICFLLSDESGLMTGAVLDFDQSVIGAGEAPVPPEGLFA